MRWLFFHRRRLAVDQATQRRKEKEEQKAAEEGATEPEVDADENVDVPALHAHTKMLFRAAVVVTLIVGLLSIWSETLPALQRLDRVQLWPSVRMLPVAETDAVTAARPTVTTDSGNATPDGSAAGTPAIRPGMLPSTTPTELEGESPEYSLTLAALLTSLLFGLMTVVVVRSVPALLEIGVLTRLPIDAGARYASATIVRYVLIGVGLTLTFGALGIGWSSIQWLAAALTFGLAFGLQEIFANFISGLILLVERPIRVGDTVTIGGVQGTVARIRTRATTILDYNNCEHLIPNKSLITDSVVNWTLTELVTRVVVPVGVAYGSDKGHVFETLQRVGDECPFALAKPAPSVLFTGFGDSSVNFDVRVFIATRSQYVATVNDLLRRIDEGFRREGIEIPFPQRDLHLRSSDVELGHSGRAGSPPDVGEKR
jgi:potassium efflux system protein